MPDILDALIKEQVDKIYIEKGWKKEPKKKKKVTAKSTKRVSTNRKNKSKINNAKINSSLISADNVVISGDKESIYEKILHHGNQVLISFLDNIDTEYLKNYLRLLADNNTLLCSYGIADEMIEEIESMYPKTASNVSDIWFKEDHYFTFHDYNPDEDSIIISVMKKPLKESTIVYSNFDIDLQVSGIKDAILSSIINFDMLPEYYDKYSHDEVTGAANVTEEELEDPQSQLEAISCVSTLAISAIFEAICNIYVYAAGVHLDKNKNETGFSVEKIKIDTGECKYLGNFNGIQVILVITGNEKIDKQFMGYYKYLVDKHIDEMIDGQFFELEFYNDYKKRINKLAN